MESPHPPCCAIPCCKRTCEQSGFCESLGKVGLKYFDEHRAVIMGIASFFSFLSIIFCIVAVCATSLEAETVKNTCWTYGETDNYKYYVGLEEIIITGGPGDDQLELEWSDAQCPDSYCEDCKDATASSVSTAIMSLVTCFPTLATDVQRSTRKGDLNCQKFMALLTGFIGTITTLSALSAYAEGCYKELPDTDFNGDDITWSLGPGFSMLMLATILKPIDVILHLLLP
ncbi:unnamed protein product, partial [Ectocarpus fasciculatus]